LEEIRGRKGKYKERERERNLEEIRGRKGKYKERERERNFKINQGIDESDSCNQVWRIPP
jgi:hypothetical protein